MRDRFYNDLQKEEFFLSKTMPYHYLQLQKSLARLLRAQAERPLTPLWEIAEVALFTSYMLIYEELLPYHRQGLKSLAKIEGQIGAMKRQAAKSLNMNILDRHFSLLMSEFRHLALQLEEFNYKTGKASHNFYKW